MVALVLLGLKLRTLTPEVLEEKGVSMEEPMRLTPPPNLKTLTPVALEEKGVSTEGPMRLTPPLNLKILIQEA